jgi:hypothetical protein
MKERGEREAITMGIAADPKLREERERRREMEFEMRAVNAVDGSIIKTEKELPLKTRRPE